MSDSMTIYKLIILYMLRKVEFPLTTAQISECVLGKEYMSYFSLQTALADLTESSLLNVKLTSNTSYYSLTESGEQTLLYFKNRIPKSFREEIDQYMADNKVKLKDESAILASYYKNTAGEFSVRCQVKEKYVDLIDLTISVPDEAQAQAISLKWNKKCQNIYEYIMKELLG